MDRNGLFEEEIWVNYIAFLFSSEMIQVLEESISVSWL